MNRRSILTNFAILALFLFPMGRTAEIEYDNCELAELVTDSRLKINLQYNKHYLTRLPDKNTVVTKASRDQNHDANHQQL